MSLPACAPEEKKKKNQVMKLRFFQGKLAVISKPFLLFHLFLWLQTEVYFQGDLWTFPTFSCADEKLFSYFSRTISVRDGGEQKRYFKPNHVVLRILMKCFLCLNSTEYKHDVVTREK